MLKVQRIFKGYDGKPILRDVSFSVAAGETVCLLGASGSGKSTLLRIIAGLEDADSGSVSFDGQDLSSTPAHLRDFGFVFQDYALFPHLNVSENVAFGLKMRRLPQNEIAGRVASSLEMVNLRGFEKRQVTDLSGGEQQRVALARALATEPRLLLLDEPFAGLDLVAKQGLLDWLRRLCAKRQVTVLLASHHLADARALSAETAVLEDGAIVERGELPELLKAPRSRTLSAWRGSEPGNR